MDRYNIYEIAEELCRLFQQQMDALGKGGLSSLSDRELIQYNQRGTRIRELLAELEKFRRPS